MRIDDEWRKLGWRHPLWDYVRYFTSLRSNENYTKDWIDKLRAGVFEIRSATEHLKPKKGRLTKAKAIPGEQAANVIPIPADDLRLFLKYIDKRDAKFAEAASQLRTKEEALAFCDGLKVAVQMTKTKLGELDWQPSPKAVVAAVTNIAQLVCQEKNVAFVPSPQRRGVWLHEHNLHVSARNLDGAIPSLYMPKILWEIKEYWGGGEGKGGGSKMSDAVYECALVGRELREYEESTGIRIFHIVFLDGKGQWADRPSDLKRFIDLFNQGFIDYLFIGKEVETDWQSTLETLLS